MFSFAFCIFCTHEGMAPHRCQCMDACTVRFACMGGCTLAGYTSRDTFLYICSGDNSMSSVVYKDYSVDHSYGYKLFDVHRSTYICTGMREILYLYIFLVLGGHRVVEPFDMHMAYAFFPGSIQNNCHYTGGHISVLLCTFQYTVQEDLRNNVVSFCAYNQKIA